MRRVQLWRALDAFNIQYSPGATAIACRKLLEANGVTDGQLMEFVRREAGQLIETHGDDEHGRPHREYYPPSEMHQSARQQANGVSIDYDALIAANAEKAEQREEVIDQQASVIKNLMERLEALETNQLPLSKMTPPQLKSIAKQRNIDTKGLKTKKELLAVLDVKNPAQRSQ